MIKFSKGTIVTNVDSIIKYINEIKRIPVLTKSEEYDLCLRIKSGDNSAVNELVRCNLRFVVHFARKYQNMGLSFEDLISFGNIGLMKAAKRFDIDRGFKFVTFAIWYIKSEITAALNELSQNVRIPNSQNSDEFYEISLESGFEIADNQKSQFEKSDLMIELKMILKSLNEVEYQAITRFYGFGHEYAQSVDDVARHIGLTSERARQIIRNSEKKLKNHPNLDILRKYLD